MRLWTAAAIQDWITGRVAALCGLDPAAIGGREPFTRHGLDSRGLVGLAGELAELLGRPVSPTLIWTHPSPRSLAEHLAENASGTTGYTVSAVAEPIAVIGLSCRFPGAGNPEEFWRLLRDGRDAITDVPAERWQPMGGVPGRGGFLDRIDEFDAGFFDISPREAAHVDPQQRLALELAWEALEDAGIPPRGLTGSRTGVFVGAMWNEYGASPDQLSQHSLAGADPSVIPARISYALGLRGPSMQVNTACSSSLVAAHLAMQALRAGDCDLALVGGVSLMLASSTMIGLHRLGALAPDGRSKAFDARADGYGRGEGGGVVVLKPLRNALADGDPIRCVIRGSAVNNDGASNGLTAPNPLAQQEVLRDAYQHAGVAAGQVQYVEAHGTGTELGDPIEASALNAVLCADRPADEPLRLGSVKANIGHLEAAAGIAGLIKVVLAMGHRALPPSVQFEEPNPHIPFTDWGLRVQRGLEEWTGDADGRLLAGVSAFGFGGTNCHLVLEGGQNEPMRLITFAAETKEELRTRARELRSGSEPGRQRLALSVRDSEDLKLGVQGFLDGVKTPGVTSGAADDDPPRVVFVFGGQGSQWPGMAADLLREEPVFRKVLARCDEVIGPRIGRSLRTMLASQDDDWLSDTAVAQPAIFAMQVALAELVRSRGIEPHAVVGTSMGEVAAAYVAGALDLETAAILMCERSRVASGLSGAGAMAVLEMSFVDVLDVMRANDGRTWVAGTAGPRSTVIAGDQLALRHIMNRVTALNIRCGLVRVDYASHSPYVDEILPELRSALSGIRARPGRIPFYSSVTGTEIPGELLDAEHWVRTERDPWQLSTAVDTMLADGYNAFLDLDPHAVLLGPLEQVIAELGKDAVALPVLRRGERGGTALTDSLGALFVRGAAVGAQRESGPELLVLSGRTEAALRESARDVAEWLVANDNSALNDVCHTMGTRRSHHEHRLSVTAESHDAMADALRSVVHGELPKSVSCGRSVAEDTVFVFSGQGTQWAGMGRVLFAREPVFRAVIQACDELFAPLAGWSLAAELHSPRLTDTAAMQPVLFAIQVGLAKVLRERGITPASVIGHSVGEVAAAHVAGVLSLPDAIRVVYHRGRVMSRTAGFGVMASVALAEEAALELAEVRAGRLAVAAVNDPGSIVLSGQHSALAEVLETLRAAGVHCRELRVDHAFHSQQMEPVLDELAWELQEITPRPAAIPVYSTVGDGEAFDADYWMHNVRDTVRFADAVGAAVDAGHRVFVEIGPHPVLVDNIEQCLAALGKTGRAVATLRRDQDDRVAVSLALGELYTLGLDVTFAEGRLVAMPGYPWQRERHWLPVERAARAPGHPLLGVGADSSIEPGTHLWQCELSPSYLADLQVNGEKVLTAAACLEMALSCRAGPFAVSEMVFEELLSLGDGRPTTQVVLTGDALVQVSSQQGDTWVRHAVANLVEDSKPVAEHEKPELIARRCGARIDGAEHYRRLAAAGVKFGEGLRGVTELRLGAAEAVGRVEIPASERERVADYRIHPALLDSCLQVAVSLANASGGAHVLVGVQWLRVHRAGLTGGWVHALSRVDSQLVDLYLLTDDGEVLAEAEGLRLEPLPNRDDPLAERLHTIEWRRHDHHPPVSASLAGTWLVLAEEGEFGPALARQLRSTGAQCVLVTKRSVDDVLRTDFATEPPAGVVHLDGAAQYGIRELARAISGRGWRDTPRLWLVTRDTQAAGQAVRVPQPDHGGTWGLGRTIALEHPEVDCTRVDVAGDDLELLVRELVGADAETDIALRPDGRYVARVVRAKEKQVLGSHGGLTFRPEATYLVVGGDGALTDWMRARGARHIVAVNDQSAEDDVVEITPQLKGIVHADGSSAVAWQLHSLSLGHDLDFFVMLSSAAALVGDPDHGGDAQTGAFLDALAHHRRALGLPAYSIGFTRDEDRAEVLSGILPTAPAQLTVVALNPRQWMESHPAAAGTPFFEELPLVTLRALGMVKDKLLAAPDERRHVVLEEHLIEQLALTLQQDPARLDRSTPFRSLGLESLMAVELRNRLEASVGVRLSVALVFTYSTVAELARYLLSELAPERETGEAEPWSSMAEDIERMSDAEAEALLLESIRLVEEGPVQ